MKYSSGKGMVENPNRKPGHFVRSSLERCQRPNVGHIIHADDEIELAFGRECSEHFVPDEEVDTLSGHKGKYTSSARCILAHFKYALVQKGRLQITRVLDIKWHEN